MIAGGQACKDEGRLADAHKGQQAARCLFGKPAETSWMCSPNGVQTSARCQSPQTESGLKIAGCIL